MRRQTPERDQGDTLAYRKKMGRAAWQKQA
jgi:hypothetical protein